MPRVKPRGPSINLLLGADRGPHDVDRGGDARSRARTTRLPGRRGRRGPSRPVRPRPCAAAAVAVSGYGRSTRVWPGPSSTSTSSRAAVALTTRSASSATGGHSRPARVPARVRERLEEGGRGPAVAEHDRPLGREPFDRIAASVLSAYDAFHHGRRACSRTARRLRRSGRPRACAARSRSRRRTRARPGPRPPARGAQAASAAARTPSRDRARRRPRCACAARASARPASRGCRRAAWFP